MSKHPLFPQGEFPTAGLIRRLAAMFYDFLLCVALLIIVTFLYKLVQMSIIGVERLKQLSDAGALDRDPLLSSILLFTLFAFFAKFWTYKGQTLGMQVWSLRIQNTDGSAISLWQALLRFLVAIASFLCFGLGYLWMLWDKQGRTWQDIYSDSRVAHLPKDVRKKK